MAYVLIVDGEVIQKQPYPDPGFISAPDGVFCGFTYEESTGEFLPPPPPPAPIPESVDRRQILTGLAQVGWITEAEAEAALTIGARPAAVDAVINALPEEQRFHARMKWAGFKNAYRDDDMVAALAAIEGKTAQEIDEFFVLCAGIE